MTDLLVRLGDASILKNGGGILVMENGFEWGKGGVDTPLRTTMSSHGTPLHWTYTSTNTLSKSSLPC